VSVPGLDRIRGHGRRALAWFAVLSFVAVLGAFTLAVEMAPAADDLSIRVRAFARAHSGRPVSLASISPSLRNAVVATEDERFYHHGGLDLIGLLRAIPYDASHFSFAQGASTIPEQLAKLLYLHGHDHAPWRKAEDAAIAIRLSSRYNREQILAAYLNVVYLGEGRHGVAAASRHYFGLPAGRLNLAQASLLAGLIQAPSRYDPAADPRAARARQLEVLRAMVRNGYVTASEAAAALGRPLRLASGLTLPTLRQASLEPGAPFDWAELALAVLLLFLALAGIWMASAVMPAPRARRLLIHAVSLALLAAGAWAAAHSIQVI
jgi:membrane peptidoglycan carboxypeptidase